MTFQITAKVYFTAAKAIEVYMKTPGSTVSVTVSVSLDDDHSTSNRGECCSTPLLDVYLCPNTVT